MAAASSPVTYSPAPPFSVAVAPDATPASFTPEKGGAVLIHGTTWTYRKYGCRCELCSTAKKQTNATRKYDAAAKQRRALRAAKGLPAGDNRHGTNNGYRNLGCRCVQCVAANTKYERERYAKYPKRRQLMLEAQSRRRARIRGNYCEPYKRADIYARDNGICYICKMPVAEDTWHLEHMQPILHGGADAPFNVAVSCPPCNLRKGSKWDGTPAPA